MSRKKNPKKIKKTTDLLLDVGIRRLEQLLDFPGEVSTHLGRADGAESTQGQAHDVLSLVVQVAVEGNIDNQIREEIY